MIDTDKTEPAALVPRSRLARIGQWIYERPWLIPVAVALMFAVFIAAMVWLDSTGWTFPHRPEKPRLIERYSIETPRGPIAVTEIRSGDEFNRILQLPDGETVAEAGYLNSWGERKINLIGAAKSK
jgi:hypothetical protein